MTAIQCYQYLRDVCSWRLINRDAPLLLGGSGHVMQIDESLFRHKVKVWSNTGLKTYSPFVTGTIRLIEDILQEQIFGFLEWWMYPIARHSVICKWYHVEMLPCCSLSYIVHSDEWAAYNHVQQLPNVHTVNHSITFVNPATGTHTQNIESYWNRVKTKFKRMKGVHEVMLTSYLDEFMWRERHGKAYSLAMQNICRDIALRYPV